MLGARADLFSGHGVANSFRFFIPERGWNRGVSSLVWGRGPTLQVTELKGDMGCRGGSEPGSDFKLRFFQ